MPELTPHLPPHSSSRQRPPPNCQQRGLQVFPDHLILPLVPMSSYQQVPDILILSIFQTHSWASPPNSHPVPSQSMIPWRHEDMLTTNLPESSWSFFQSRLTRMRMTRYLCCLKWRGPADRTHILSGKMLWLYWLWAPTLFSWRLFPVSLSVDFCVNSSVLGLCLLHHKTYKSTLCPITDHWLEDSNNICLAPYFHQSHVDSAFPQLPAKALSITSPDASFSQIPNHSEPRRPSRASSPRLLLSLGWWVDGLWHCRQQHLKTAVLKHNYSRVMA